MLAALLMMAQPVPPAGDCPWSAEERDRCELARSLAIEPAPDCEKRSTDRDWSICNWRDYYRADLEMLSAWDEVAARYRTKEAFNSIEESQRVWLLFRDSNCKVYDQIFQGVAKSQAVGSCRAAITKGRTFFLRELLLKR